MTLTPVIEFDEPIVVGNQEPFYDPPVMLQKVEVWHIVATSGIPQDSIDITSSCYTFPAGKWIVEDLDQCVKIVSSLAEIKTSVGIHDMEGYCNIALGIAQLSHDKTPNPHRSRLAFGTIKYTRESDGETAWLNSTLTQDESKIGLYFWDPKHGNFITLSKAELSSCSIFRL
jgi:hypothetical protein